MLCHRRNALSVFVYIDVRRSREKGGISNLGESRVKSFRQLRVFVCVAIAALTALATRDARAASVAADDASNYSSFGAFSASNLGTGFGAWTLTGSDNNS